MLKNPEYEIEVEHEGKLYDVQIDEIKYNYSSSEPETNSPESFEIDDFVYHVFLAGVEAEDEKLREAVISHIDDDTILEVMIPIWKQERLDYYEPN